MSYREIEENVLSKLKQIDKVYLKAFLYSFILINIAYLFHSINFMFGDHDWLYLRKSVAWNEGNFEGRPFHFLLQNIIFGGQYFPILNNLFSFAALALSGILLAKYWKLPQNTVTYTLFASFVAVLPYTLVWLYYTKDTLINLSLPLICILSVMSAEKGKVWHIGAISLMFIAFSSYVAVVDYIGIIVLGNMIFSYILTKTDIVKIVKQKLPTICDVIIAGVLYLLVIKSANLTSEYNTGTIDMAYFPEKLRMTIVAMFTQFTMPLPFMEFKFKLIITIAAVMGYGIILYRGGWRKVFPLTMMLFVAVFCSKFAFMIAEERGQILAEMENFAYVPRLDFYGLPYIWALGIGGLLLINHKTAKKAVITICSVLIFMSAVRDMYAQKVWKFGFDAEMKAHERIVTRLESMPQFDVGRKYRLLQLGSLSLRQNFYQKRKGEQISLDLLETSYTPEFMSHIVYNFYYPQEVFTRNAGVEELTSRGREFLQKQAKVWPSKEAIFIDGDIVIVVLSEEKLQKVRRGF